MYGKQIRKPTIFHVLFVSKRRTSYPWKLNELASKLLEKPFRVIGNFFFFLF